MWKKTVRVLSFPVGAAFGISLADMVLKFIADHPSWSITINALANGVVYGASGVVFGLLVFFLSAGFVDWLQGTLSGLEKDLRKMPIKELLFCICGFFIGMLIAFLISLPILIFLGGNIVTITISAVLYVSFASLGIRVSRSRMDDIKLDLEPSTAGARCILDSSVIIDGRIVDIFTLGFISGEIIITAPVLSEIRRIADSDDVLKRARGRRGLDMIARIQETEGVKLHMDDSVTSETDIDTYLVKKAKALEACLITNDYNLSKLGKMQNVKVLNINDLSNAVKPIMLPGEEMNLQIVKEGKEYGQGIAYLDDGTMIVVENARRFLGQMVPCLVTSVLQTSAGRMIFAKLKEDI